ncbi:DUF4359 domain-containing protein [Leptolyngbya ohadii]|uniref:DUF4359 domain-containing protein n=1 Tax=Leptolyngbya ohadii TaxID=1962290 RepID=UPI000B5A0822|nr:DUF4359 domain-containing protein [Leptolyngbya ohadii]
MKNSLFALILVAGGFFVTNPDQPAYVDFAAVRFANATQDAICRLPGTAPQGNSTQTPEFFQSIASSIQELCRGAVTAGTNFGREPLQNYINSKTQRQNFLLFSLYTTEFPGYQIKTIGVLGNFFPMQ